MAWDKDTAAITVAGVGSAATAVAAVFVWWQVWSASDALHANNAYLVQKDLLEAYDRVLEAEDQIAPQNSSEAKAALKRRAIHLDTMIEIVDALQANGGIAPDSWKQILKNMCPNFEKVTYRFGDVQLPAAKAACDRDFKFWKDQPK
jgi:hypothetical protein